MCTERASLEEWCMAVKETDVGVGGGYGWSGRWVSYHVHLQPQ